MRKYPVLKCIILFICVLAGIVVFRQSQTAKTASEFENKEQVYACEILDMFEIADIGNEEMQAMLLPKVSSVLTENDVNLIYTTLGFSAIDDKTGETPIQRSEWTACYEQLLQSLGKTDQVEILRLRYLGMVPGEKRIITDQGNFNTSIEESFWTYGAYYEVYATDNNILLIRQEQGTSGLLSRFRKGKAAERQQGQNTVAVPQTVRVVLTNDNGRKALRQQFQILCESGCTVNTKDQTLDYGEHTILTQQELKDLADDSNGVTVIPKTEHTLYLQDADTGNWSAAYRGIFIIYQKDNAYWIVNQVPLEEYIYGVLPGEMPESFEPEALKAQAVCARTFACQMIQNGKYGEYQADVDDSVNSQVYNRNGENEKSIQVADATKGQILVSQADQQPAFVYYYSTSCGISAGMEAWGQESVPYLKSISLMTTLPENLALSTESDSIQITSCQIDWDSFLKRTDIAAYDSESRYFRWKAYITLPRDTYFFVEKRESSGEITDIRLQTGNQTSHIVTENEIRQEIGKYLTAVEDKNGQKNTSMKMLPSAWFTIEAGTEPNSYILYGGGLGHGIGMSQYGANGMAKSGKDYEEILQSFFHGTEIKS